MPPASVQVWARRALIVTGIGGGAAIVALSWPRQDRTPMVGRTPGSNPLAYINLGASITYYHFGYQFRRFVDAETGHRWAVRAAAWPESVRLALGLVLPDLRYDNLRCAPFEQLQQQQEEQARTGARTATIGTTSSPSPPLKSLQFAHPLGLAAGFDKHAEAINGLLDMGFASVEIGSVTPLPQDGNPRPRVFRLEEDRAIINRYGFNSDGADRVAQRLQERAAEQLLASPPHTGIVGVNLGKNKETVDAAADYQIGVDKLARFADYLVVNVSSPNTPGLRALQQKSELRDLLFRVKERRDHLFRRLAQPAPPLLVKIAPDLSESDKQDIADVVLELRLDGLVISNTTVARPPQLRSPNQLQSGGLSGAPLKHVSTDLVRDMYRRTKGQVVIIGVGGVESGVDAYAKIKAGASLVQVYSTFALNGPYQLHSIKRDLSTLIKQDGFNSVQEAVGIDVRREQQHATAAPIVLQARTAV